MRVITLPLLLLFCWLVPPLAGQTPNWKTGPQFRQQLETETSVTWEGRECRELWRRLSEQQQVAVVLDRRADPAQLVSLTLRNVPLRTVFAELAAAHGQASCVVGNVVYCGPASVAAVLPTAAAVRAEELKKLAATARFPWQQQQSLAWNDLAEPRQLVQALLQPAAIQLTNPELLPHDLWAANSLPALTLVDRLSLILAQFDLTFAVDKAGRQVTLIPLPKELLLERLYPGGARPAERLVEWQRLAPQAEIALVGRQLRVRGSLADHELLDRDNKPIPAGQTVIKEKRYTLTVENKPLGAVLGALSKQLDLTLEMDAEAIRRADVSLDQLVSFEVRDQTADELFSKLLKPHGLVFRLQGETLEVRAK